MTEPTFDIILTKYFTGELSEEESAKVISWRNNSFKNFTYFNQVKRLFLSVKIKNNHLKFNANKAWEEFEKKHTNSIKAIPKLLTSFNNSILLRVAAIITIVLSLGYFSYDFITNYGFSNKAYVHTIVPKGQTSQLLLPDSTKIWLNSGSTLKYPNRFNETSREVFLEGEAFFDVRPDPLKPFIIKTSGPTIKVLGTKFNVSSYENDDCIETTVVNGSVEVFKSNRKSDNRVVLEPNQKATYNKNNNEIELQDVDAELYTAWMNGKYIFKNEELGEIAKKIERAYDYNIYFRDVELQNIRLSGRFKNSEPIEQILEVIRLTSPIEYRINKRDIFIYERTILIK
ncbi:MAG: DUF4974 domain-containing protein [Bacteroidales bacterium]|nr:DUF4974 domain-containing protein [Bacteroidales bacterium]